MRNLAHHIGDRLADTAFACKQAKLFGRDAAEHKFAHRLDGIEKSVNELYLKSGRPGGGRDEDNLERKDWPRCV